MSEMGLEFNTERSASDTSDKQCASVMLIDVVGTNVG